MTPDKPPIYFQTAHGDRNARMWIWNGSAIEARPGDRTHAEAWGLAPDYLFKGRWDGQTLTVVIPFGKPRIVPQFLADALEREFGTGAETLVF